MTLRFLDSCAHYAAGDILTKYTSRVSTTQQAITTGRFSGSSALQIGTGGTQNSGLNKVLTTSHATAIMGFGFRATVSGSNYVSRLMEGGGATEHGGVRFNGTFLQVNRAGTLVTGTTAIVTNRWYYVELKYVVHDTTGSYELRIDGVTELSATNVDTRNGGTSGVIDSFTIGTVSGSNVNYEYADIYFCDGAGSTNNDFLGDVRVEALFPNGNGNSSQLVGSDGNSTDNYLLVDETTTTNATTDYVQSATTGEQDTYTYTNMTALTGTVYGLQILPYGIKADAGTRSIYSVARVAGVEENGPIKPLSASATYYPDIRETKPGGGAWSISDVNGAEFGVEVY